MRETGRGGRREGVGGRAAAPPRGPATSLCPGGDEPFEWSVALCPGLTRGPRRLGERWKVAETLEASPHPLLLWHQPTCVHVTCVPPARAESHPEPRSETRGACAHSVISDNCPLSYGAWRCVQAEYRHPRARTRSHTRLHARTRSRTRPFMHACRHVPRTQRPVLTVPQAPCRGHAGRPQPLASAGGTHLEVPVDDPHLVAVENRLQDLLDAVTAADSTCVSAVAHRVRGAVTLG